ncbi:hypothetical protein ACLKA6_018923 [Drosophila palustris]
MAARVLLAVAAGTILVAGAATGAFLADAAMARVLLVMAVLIETMGACLMLLSAVSREARGQGMRSMTLSSTSAFVCSFLHSVSQIRQNQRILTVGCILVMAARYLEYTPLVAIPRESLKLHTNGGSGNTAGGRRHRWTCAGCSLQQLNN